MVLFLVRHGYFQLRAVVVLFVFSREKMWFCPAVDEVKPSPSSRMQVFGVEHLSPGESGSSPEGFLMEVGPKNKKLVFGKLCSMKQKWMVKKRRQEIIDIMI